MVSEGKRELREQCIRIWKDYNLSKVFHDISKNKCFADADDYLKTKIDGFHDIFNEDKRVRLFKRNEDFGVSLIDDFICLCNNLDDEMIRRVNNPLTYPNKHSLVFEVSRIEYKKEQVFVSGYYARFHVTDALSVLKKDKLATLDYYFDCFCNIDYISWIMLQYFLLPLYDNHDNESIEDRTKRIDDNIDKIFSYLCDLLKTVKKPYDITVINKLPSLLKLSSVTSKDYKNIKNFYTDKKPSEILESIMKKIEVFDKGRDREDIKFEYLFFSYIRQMLDFEYFKLFKVSVPLTLLSKRCRALFYIFMLDEFDVGLNPVGGWRVPDDDTE